MSAVSKAAREHQYKTAMERYFWYKDAGICPRCLANSEPGKVYCKGCYDKMYRKAAERDPTGEKKNQLARERRAWRKANGICTDCGKSRTVEGKVRCRRCEAKARDSRIKYNIHQRTLKEGRQWEP